MQFRQWDGDLKVNQVELYRQSTNHIDFQRHTVKYKEKLFAMNSYVV